MPSSSKYTEILRARNLKATTTRVDVLTAIAAHQKAIAHSVLQESLNNFDRVTLYRTLNVLIDNGIIHKAMANENDTFYAMCSASCTSHTHNHQHVHFKCTVCNEVSCVHTSSPITLNIPGYVIADMEIQVTGTCPNCLP